MRFYLFVLFICIVLIPNSTKSQSTLEAIATQKASFKLYINGIEKVEGEIRIAIFDSKNKYTKDPIHAVVLPISDTKVELELENMSYGEYAIAVYHDQNKNGKLDTNLLGMPKEKYGFSNNARGKFGPASWDDAVFEIASPTKVAEISIK
ncbi:MAG: DUF2141 domain-containing protein [Balneolaceae bacterium]